MKALSKHLFAAALGATLLASCSRPVAYFQPTQREHFSSPKTEAVTAVTPVEAAQPVATPVSAPEAVPTSAEQIAQAKTVMSQVEAYVRNDSKLASNKTLAKRMARANALMATATNKAAVGNNATAAKKMTFMERTMLKKMDKKIKKHVAPNETKALSRNLRNGIIIGAIGFILALFFGGPIGVIGVILLVVGVVLILLGVLDA